MAITLSGRLQDPFGNALENAGVRFRSARTSSQVLANYSAETTTDSNGDYTISVQFGVFHIEARQSTSDPWYTIARSIPITVDTTSTDINGLIVAYLGAGDATPEIVLEIESITATATAAASSAAASAQSASESAALSSERVAFRATIDALADFPTENLSGGEGALVTTTGRAGEFTWTTGDQSSNVAMDAAKGVWVPPSSDTTGASGAWQRNYSKLTAEFFGAVRNDGSDSAPYIQAGLDYLHGNGGGELHLNPGTYRTESVIYIRSNTRLIGAGIDSTYIESDFAPVSGAKAVVRSAAIAVDGTSADDDYSTYSASTGDYFTTGPRPFASGSAISSGEYTFTAASASDLSDVSVGDFIYLSEGVASWHPAKSEFVQVASISGAVVTTKNKIRNSYSNTDYSLGSFIRSYDLVGSPGGGGAGYPDMSSWGDSGFRKVSPVSNTDVSGITINVTRSGNARIAFLNHLGVNNSWRVKAGGSFWNLDSQGTTLIVDGFSTVDHSSYAGNGCNDVNLRLRLTNQVAIEEGAQNIYGSIVSEGYNTVKDYCSNVNVSWTSSGGNTPGVEISKCRDVSIRPSISSGNAAVKNSTPKLSQIAPDMSQSFMDGEAMAYYSGGVTLVGGECISRNAGSVSIECSEGEASIRCLNTTVPKAQTSRYKGSVVVSGSSQPVSISDHPLFYDLEQGESFTSSALGDVRVLLEKETTISSQFDYPSRSNLVIVDNISSGWSPSAGDVIAFKVSDVSSGPENWEWHVAYIVRLTLGAQVVEYLPENPAGKVAITASNEDRVKIFKLSSSVSSRALKTASSGIDAENGGFISGVGQTASSPLQLGSYHLWVDSTGALRIKDGAPTSDTDGNPV